MGASDIGTNFVTGIFSQFGPALTRSLARSTIFEVLSPRTARDDRIVKAREYQATPSVKRYVRVEQDGVSATVYARAGEIWIHDILIADSTFSLSEIGVSLPLAEIYDGVVFETDRTADREPA